MQFNTAFTSCDILLPDIKDMSKWSVVACDQFTGEPEYWDKTKEIVGGDVSTLNLILPEVYLEDDDVDSKIAEVNKNIDKYLADGVFKELKNAMVYVRRTQSDGKLREGIVGAVDLEKYDYRSGSKSQIRATEATVAERIPPRLKIRRNASVELPHIMILIDDPEKSVIEPLSTSDLEKLYDFELMQGGGRIEGYLLGEDEISRIDSALCELSKKCEMLYAMGDGNHSLATAKEHYEKLKRDNPGADLSNHPARYALCEIVNLHSPALEFEAIHRIVTDVDCDKLIADMTKVLGLSDSAESEQRIRVITSGTEKELYITRPLSKLAVGSLQAFLDKYLKENGGKIDYIHGDGVLRSLASKENSVGFILEPMKKSELFAAVISDGALPRKTFSMGHAQDKRYYLEAKKIV